MATTKPRRRPRRRTSAEIVGAILDAASEQLADGGLAAMTTNRLAERAGVSVGSLYHYFPNKQAVVAGVTGRLNRELTETIRWALAQELSPRERVLAAWDAYVGFGHVPLRLAILRDVPRSWDETGIEESERGLREITDTLAASFTSLDPDDARERLLSVIFAGRGLVQGALLTDPRMLEGDALRARMADAIRLWLPER